MDRVEENLAEGIDVLEQIVNNRRAHLYADSDGNLYCAHCGMGQRGAGLPARDEEQHREDCAIVRARAFLARWGVS